MNASQAKNKVRRILTEYQVFKDLEEILDVAVQAEAEVAALDASRKSLVADIEYLAAIQVDANSDLKGIEEYYSSVIGGLKEDKESAKSEIAAIKKKGKAAESEALSRIDAIKEDYVEAVKCWEQRVSELKEEADAAEMRLAKARKDLADLKGKL